MPTRESIRVKVELTEDELVTLLAWVAPDSELMNRLNEALRARHTRSSGDAASFCFSGTVGEAIALLELATARASEAVPRIGRAVLLATVAEAGVGAVP